MIRRYHLHLPALLYIGMTVLVGLAAVNRQNNLLFWVLGVMLSALLLSGLVSGVMMQSLRVRRLVARHGAVGEPLTVRYSVTNRSRWLPAFGLHLEERRDGAGWPALMAPARAWVMHLGPRETVHGEAVFWPTARGEARFGRLRIWTTFPFGIIKKSITVDQPQHTLIYPRLFGLRRDVLRSIEPQGVAGSRTSSRPGPGDDYYGMREFRPGDSARQIAWKRTAALDELVCIERTRPTPPRVRVVLNLTVPTTRLGPDAAAARELEEQAVSLAASIVQEAHQRGFEVGLAIPGTAAPPMLIRRSHWHRGRIMAALAAIDLDAPRVRAGVKGAGLGGLGERASQIVVHPDRVEPGLGRDDALHLSARHLDRLVAVVPAPAPTTAPTPPHPPATSGPRGRAAGEPAEAAA